MLAAFPRVTSPRYSVIGGCMDPRARLNALEKWQIPCSCREWNNDSSDIQPVAYWLHRLHYPGHYKTVATK
jgi:hypothetical protein